MAKPKQEKELERLRTAPTVPPLDGGRYDEDGRRLDQATEAPSPAPCSAEE